MLWAQEAEEVKLVRGSRLCQGTYSRLVMCGRFHQKSTIVGQPTLLLKVSLCHVTLQISVKLLVVSY